MQAQARPEREPSLLLGGAAPRVKKEIFVDPRLPSGELRERLQGPERAPTPSSRLCSARRPLCVVGARKRSLPQALTLLEAAYERHRFGAGLPTYDASLPALEWWLTPEELQIDLQERPSRLFDRASARCRGGHLTARDAQRCITEASLGALAPATAPALRSGSAVASSWDFLGLQPEDEPLLEQVQAHPERGLLTREAHDVPETRSALFFQYLSEVATQSSPGAPGFVALSLAATRTPADSLRYLGDPDLFDVLRVSLREDRERLAHLLDDFTAARRRLGRPGGLFPELGRTIEPRLAWRIPSTTLPRHLVLPRPLEPTGSAFLKVELENDTPLLSLGVRVTCETPVSYQWSIARLDAQGVELSRLRITFQERGSIFEQRIDREESTAAFLIQGTNLGGVDLSHPFDPDHSPHEAHLCSVYLARLEAPPPAAQEPASQ